MARQGLPRISNTGAAGSEASAAGRTEAQAAAPTSGPSAPGVGIGTGDAVTSAPASKRRGLPRPTEPIAGPPTIVPTEPAASEAPAPAEERSAQLLETSSDRANPADTAGRVRETGLLEKLGGSRMGKGIFCGVGLLLALAAVVLAARWAMTTEPVQGFITHFPGETELPHGAPEGLPAWLAWQHFFNIFLMVLIIRSGWQVRTQRRPPATWIARWGANPKKISINLWLHQSLDILWMVNGVIFVVLLVATGQWMRVVPTSWEVFPNALSAILQYASLDWPTENGWVNYNSLQVLTYFVTIFVASPLAAFTGVRMSGAWPSKAPRLSRMYPVEVARAIHLPVMFYFVGFIIVHVGLVLSTGALRNLNHMYGGQDAVNWYGFWIFFISLLVIVAGWLAARPLILAPIASLLGKVGR